MPKSSDYSIRLFYSPEDSEFVAISPEFPGLSALAQNQPDAVKELQEVISMALKSYRDTGKTPPQPAPPEDTVLPSGEFRVRLPRTLHAQLSRKAQDEGVSQNTLLIQYVAQGLAHAPLARKPKPAA